LTLAAIFEGDHERYEGSDIFDSNFVSFVVRVYFGCGDAALDFAAKSIS
jgi:hypothetical protein